LVGRIGFQHQSIGRELYHSFRGLFKRLEPHHRSTDGDEKSEVQVLPGHFKTARKGVYDALQGAATGDGFKRLEGLGMGPDHVKDEWQGAPFRQLELPLEELQLPGPGLGGKPGAVIESEFPQSRRAACARLKPSHEFCQGGFAGILRIFSDPHGVKSESGEDLSRRTG
jgi:hypothetical protein